jgi:hypothetical protein
MTLTAPPVPPPPGRHRRRAMHRYRLARRVLALLLVLGVAGAGVSYARALTAPGAADWATRSVDWVRGHGGSGVVDVAETIYYALNAPDRTALDPGAVPATAPAPVASLPGARPADLPRPAGTPAVPGEATWSPAPQRVGGVPSAYTAWFRPDGAHPGLAVGVAWMNQALVRTELIAGTREPGGGAGPEQAQVPLAERGGLVAAFNSGWKMQDIGGGWYAHGHAVRPLRDGDASLVIDTSGRATVGAWGRDVTMTPDVASVRQNLTLVVDNGAPVPGLASSSGTWGNAKNQLQFTWRSGVGTDAAGNLVYVAGDQLNLSGLATAMAEAGIQRGMELDIHSGMNSFSTFAPAPGTTAGAVGTKLLPGMTRPADRYLVPDQRDFFAVTLRRGTGG